MNKNEIMSKTKIVCTIGPASESKEMLTKLVKAGMNVMRLNFSHGTHEEHEEKINTLLEINKEIIRTKCRYFIIYKRTWKLELVILLVEKQLLKKDKLQLFV